MEDNLKGRTELVLFKRKKKKKKKETRTGPDRRRTVFFWGRRWVLSFELGDKRSNKEK